MKPQHLQDMTATSGRDDSPENVAKVSEYIFECMTNLMNSGIYSTKQAVQPLTWSLGLIFFSSSFSHRKLFFNRR